ncbi:MAG: aminotransferase class IV [Bacteroidota bacterium]
MIVYLNEEFLDKSAAHISPEDRGFMLADGVYEVIKVYKGHPFRMDDHMQRLKSSLNAIHIRNEDTEAIKYAGLELIQRNNLQHEYAGIYIQVTRGAHPRIHHFPTDIVPTIYVSVFPFPGRFQNMKKGVAVISRPDNRWLRCNIKSIALLPNTLLYEEAVRQNASECVLIRDGVVTEASHSNVGIIKNGVFITHPDSNLILPGITKKVVLEICRHKGIPVSEKPFPAAQFDTIDEMMLMGTGNEVTPVIRVDDALIGNGKPGKFTRMLQVAFFNETYGNLAGDMWYGDFLQV